MHVHIVWREGCYNLSIIALLLCSLLFVLMWQTGSGLVLGYGT